MFDILEGHLTTFDYCLFLYNEFLRISMNFHEFQSVCFHRHYEFQRISRACVYPVRKSTAF